MSPKVFSSALYLLSFAVKVFASSILESYLLEALLLSVLRYIKNKETTENVKNSKV